MMLRPQIESKMDIPFMRLDREYAVLRDEILEAADAVFRHGRVLQGPEVAWLEAELADLFGTAHSVAVGSGTDALTLSLKAAGVQRGARVAVTSLSFVASASAIVNAGAVPVFVDVDEHYLTDTGALLSLIRRREVSAVVAVHLYGQMIALERIYEEAKASGVVVIEDAAQAFGATHNGTAPGAHSDLACVSFDPTKLLSAYGSGGAILCNDDDLAARLARLRYHGHAGGHLYTEVGHNSQLPSLQAALLSLKLKYVRQWKHRRNEIAQIYSSAIAEIDSIVAPGVAPGNEHTFHKYVLTVPTGRDELASFLRESGVSTAVHYKLPLHKQPCFSDIVPSDLRLPNAEKATEQVLSLPMYPQLTDEEVHHICDAISTFQE